MEKYCSYRPSVSVCAAEAGTVIIIIWHIHVEHLI